MGPRTWRRRSAQNILIFPRFIRLQSFLRLTIVCRFPRMANKAMERDGCFAAAAHGWRYTWSSSFTLVASARPGKACAALASVTRGFGHDGCHRTSWLRLGGFGQCVCAAGQPERSRAAVVGGAAGFGLATCRSHSLSLAGGGRLPAPGHLIVVSGPGLRHYPWLYNHSFKPTPLRGAA